MPQRARAIYNPHLTRVEDNDVDLEAARQAIMRYNGNITKAAKELEVTPHDLRRAISRYPALLEAQVETQEQMVDKAEDVLRETLESEKMHDRLSAAATILHSSMAARRRGF
jgi:hypothetical protein